MPILQALLENPQRHFALVLTPTRELAFQISEQFEALGKHPVYLMWFYIEILMKCDFIFLGASIGVKSVVIVGGMDMMSQALLLAKKPHIIIATPGRLVDHLSNTKGFNLRYVINLILFK